MTDSAASLQALIDGLDELGERPLLEAWDRDTPVTWTYADVHRCVRRLALGLHRRLDPGEPVAILAPNSAEWLVALLAIVRAGAVAVPVDVQSDAEALAHVLEDAGVRRVFTGKGYEQVAREARASVRPVQLEPGHKARDDAHWQDLAGDRRGELPTLAADATAVLFYTSGTTGPPKGVPLSHANLAHQLESLEDAGIVGAGDRVLLPLPLHHVYPLVVGALTPLHLGLTLILPHALTGRHLLRAVRRGRATVMIGVPRLFEAMYDGAARRAAEGGATARYLFHGISGISRAAQRHLSLPLGRWLGAPLRRRIGPDLEVLASGGSPLPERLARNLEALGFRIAEGYGLTETSPLVTINPPGRGRLGSVGLPAPGTRLRIDTDAVSERQGGTNGITEGEIQVRGPGVFSGYHNRDDATRSAFTDDGWYKTGDLGWCDDDGYLYVTGRLSTLLVTRSGKNVQPDDLERRYARHPDVGEIGVLERDGELVAVAVPRPQDDGTRLRRALSDVAATLPSHQRLADVRVSTRALPRTRLGKIQRHRLEARFDRAGDAGQESRRRQPQSLASMNAEDRALLDEPAAAAAWQVLTERFPDTGLSLDADPRLDLGIDSMAWLDLTLDIGERAGVELDETVIDQVETVRDLLEEVSRGAPAATAPGSPLDDPLEHLDASHRRWLEPRGRTLETLARALHAVDRLLLRGVFRLRVTGLERLPRDDAYVLICNHQSYLDPFAVAASLPRRHLESLYWGGWTGAAFTTAVKRTASRAARVVPVDPRRGARSSLALAAAVLEADQGLIWFPEGERSRDGELQSFRPGIGMLLARHPRPVVLATIRGSHRAMPVGQRLPRPRPIEIHFAESVHASRLAEEGRGDERSQRIVDALERRMRRLLYDAAA